MLLPSKRKIGSLTALTKRKTVTIIEKLYTMKIANYHPNIIHRIHELDYLSQYCSSIAHQVTLHTSYDSTHLYKQTNYFYTDLLKSVRQTLYLHPSFNTLSATCVTYSIGSVPPVVHVAIRVSIMW